MRWCWQLHECRAACARPHPSSITEPVLLVHGRAEDTCPPRWARATQSAMQRAGVDSTLEWYDDGHAFGPGLRRRDGLS